MDTIKKEVIKLYNSGISATAISNKLKISRTKVNIYIIENRDGLRGVARYLFYQKGLKRENICSRLNISESELIEYISNKEIEETINQYKNQDGKSPLITNLYKNYRKVKRQSQEVS